MRSRPSSPVTPVPGPGRRRRAWRPGTGAALATAAVLALAAIAPSAWAAPGARPATAAAFRLKFLTAAGPAAMAAPVTGGFLPRPGGGAVLWEQADGHRYSVPDVTAPHARWQPAAGARPAARHGQAEPVLRLKVTDLAGKPASNVQVVLMNTDNARLDPAPVSVTGTARVTVPAGDYSLFAIFLDSGAKGNVVAFHCVLRDDFKVTAAGATVTIAERSATSPISFTTPRQASGVDLETAFFRGSKVGAGTGTGLIIGPPYMVPTYISPQPAPKVGTLRYLERWSGAGSSGRYWYDAAFAFPGIPPSEHFVVRGSQVATIHEHFFADAAAPSIGQGLWAEDPCDAATSCGGYSNAAALVYFSAPQIVDMPGNLTVYLDTASGDQWVSAVQTTNYAYLVADPQTFLAGHDYSVDWAHGPLAAGLGQHRGPWQCQACTAGRTLSLNFSSLGDSDPSHFVPPVRDQRLQPLAHFTLYRDGTKLVSLGKASGAVVHIPAGPASYRAVLNVNLTHDPGFSQSTQSHTVLTVRYLPGAGPALPAADICSGQSATAPCRMLPALTLGYQLATSQSNTSNTATQVLHLRVGHLSYDGVGSHAAIKSAAVWVSFDGGKSWRQAKVTGTAGRYAVTWPNPAYAADTSPDIRVTASDTIGGSITQTITSAYTIESIGRRAGR